MVKNKTKHIFENGYYLIGNKAVAQCYMFSNDGDCEKFRIGLETHLEPVCDIMAFGLLYDEFQLVIKIKTRKEIENHYLVSHEKSKDEGIPETTYIISQIMANLQSGYVKSFNHKYNRDGGLMKSRYFRQLIESEEELEKEIERVNNLIPLFSRASIWTFRRKGKFDSSLEKKKWSRSSWGLYHKEMDQNRIHRVNIRFIRCLNLSDVRGHFKNLPPKALHPSKMKIFLFNNTSP